MVNNSKLQVLYQFDNKYAPYGGVSITSLFENNKEASEIVVYILDDDGNPISGDNRDRFAELAHRYSRTINIIDSSSLSRLIEELKIPTYRGCNAANMRLFIDKVLPDLKGKLLYLDADTVVCGSLEELFGKELNSAIGMVYESQGCGIRNELGLQEEQGYYNSGVILYNLDKWKEEGCSEKIIEHAKNVRAAYVSPDQDLLNVVLKGCISTLDMKYNFQPLHVVYSREIYRRVYNTKPYYQDSELDYSGRLYASITESMRVDSMILHCYRYLGRFPWHLKSKHPFTAVWDYYLAMSPWGDLSKQEEKVSVAIWVEIILYSLLPQASFLHLFRFIQTCIQWKDNRKLIK